MQHQNDALVPGSRIVHLCGEVDEDLTRKVINGLYALNVQESSCPIDLLITSGGGGLLEAQAIADAIADIATRFTVNGYVRGQAMSAAMYPLLACTKRFATRSSVLMVHGFTDGVQGDMRHVEVTQAINQKLVLEGARMFALRTGKPESYWLPILRDHLPRYYMAEEAVEEGLIDDIV